MVTSHSQIHDCPGVYLASVCTCVSLCVFKFCSAESLANPLRTSQCPVSEELWPLSSCSLLNPLKKKWEGCLNANESVCSKTCPGGHTPGSGAALLVRLPRAYARSCARTCRLRVDRLCSARILLRIKWSCCNYISLGIGKRGLLSLIHQIKWTPGADLLCKYLCSLKQVVCVSYSNCWSVSSN